MSGTRIRIKLGGRVQQQQSKGGTQGIEETAKSQENGQNPEGNNAATAITTSQNTQNVTNNILGMVSPGASPKLPSFKKTAKLKVKQPIAGSSSSNSSSDASASTSNAAVSRPVKPKKASGKAAIDWTSSSGDNDEQGAESAPKQAPLSNGKDGHPRKPSVGQKGKGKAKQTPSELLSVTTHEDGQNNAVSSHSVDTTPLASTSGSPVGSATPSNPAHTSHFAGEADRYNRFTIPSDTLCCSWTIGNYRLRPA